MEDGQGEGKERGRKLGRAEEVRQETKEDGNEGGNEAGGGKKTVGSARRYSIHREESVRLSREDYNTNCLRIAVVSMS